VTVFNTEGLTGLSSSNTYIIMPIHLCATIQLSFYYYNIFLKNLHNRFEWKAIMHDPLQPEETPLILTFRRCLLSCINQSWLTPCSKFSRILCILSTGPDDSLWHAQQYTNSPYQAVPLFSAQAWVQYHAISCEVSCGQNGARQRSLLSTSKFPFQYNSMNAVYSFV
jgi:hypothetical protein